MTTRNSLYINFQLPNLNRIGMPDHIFQGKLSVRVGGVGMQVFLITPLGQFKGGIAILNLIYINVADFVGSTQSSYRLAFWQELVSNITTITGLSEGSNDSRVVQLLGLIDFSTTRDSSCMHVPDIHNVGCQHLGDVAFLNLHVIDIIQQLQI